MKHKPLDRVWIVKHSWPNQDGYSVMPEAFASEGEALRHALRYLSQETTSGHKYEVADLTLVH